jgi:hypothetical protein
MGQNIRKQDHEKLKTYNRVGVISSILQIAAKWNRDDKSGEQGLR